MLTRNAVLDGKYTHALIEHGDGIGRVPGWYACLDNETGLARNVPPGAEHMLVNDLMNREFEAGRLVLDQVAPGLPFTLVDLSGSIHAISEKKY